MKPAPNLPYMSQSCQLPIFQLVLCSSNADKLEVHELTQYFTLDGRPSSEMA